MRKLLSLAPLLLLLMTTPAHANLWGKVKIACPPVLGTDGLPRIEKSDPIVSPGQPGEADHWHTMQCSTAWSASMTTGDQLAGGTTSFLRENKSSAWVSAFVKDGVRYPASFSTYYAGNGANPAGIAGGRIMPPPPGLRFVMGDSHSPVLQSTSFIRWRCGQNVATSQAPPTPANCSSSFALEIDGPECWDGMRLDSPDHKSHMARQISGGACPASHPVRIPQLHGLRFDRRITGQNPQLDGHKRGTRGRLE